LLTEESRNGGKKRILICL